MNRNSESHFSQLPSVRVPRSVMDLSHGYTTTCDAGELIPVMCMEVLAGDTFEITTSLVARAQTMLSPVMANINIDYYFFFESFTHMWEHFPEFFGENRQSAWVQPVEYQIPTISSPEGGFATGTLADYFKLPVGVEWSASDPLAPTCLMFRGYANIADQWFRDQNVTDPLNIPKGDSNQTGTNGDNYINDVANGGKPFIVAKYHDYFTSALPDVQKAKNPVTFGTNAVIDFNTQIPVYPMGKRAFDPMSEDAWPVIYGSQSNNSYKYMEYYPDSSVIHHGTTNVTEDESGNLTKPTTWPRNTSESPINLFANLDNEFNVSGVSFTINELRLAFRLQKFYEIQARSGSRMIEVIQAHFGVTSLDARVQRSEYLGGKRVSLNVHEITNTAQSSQDFLGDVGGKLATSDIDSSVLKSFTEPGYIYCLAAVRYPHVYSQGIPKQFMRKRFDQFYWPVMAGIGEQPIYDAELYASSETIANDTVFGYQEAYADYRYQQSSVTGEMRPGIQNSLAYWNLADHYTEKPTLSDGWIREDKTNIDRTLAVTSQNSNQFLLDFWFDIKATRPMPIYSIPGMVERM